MAHDEGAALNVPSLVTLAVVSYFLIRWFFNREDSGTRETRVHRTLIEQTDRISQMFPQANRREVMWDLARNGGNVAATTERILTGGRLDTPPRNFQPDIPPAPEAPTVRAPDATPPKPAAESLIARYNLVDRVKEESLSPSPEEGASADNSRSPSPATKSAWSQNKAERQRLLQKRRDDMILAARRRMVEKEKTKGSGNA